MPEREGMQQVVEFSRKVPREDEGMWQAGGPGAGVGNGGGQFQTGSLSLLPLVLSQGVAVKSTPAL